VLSRKAKESIKVALAMTIAYGISLSQDWDRPYWAGFAVAFVSLASIGQSMNKATLRMFGTLMAMVVALTFIALFAQERWAFILTLSVYAGFCAYMMSGSKHAYFWQVSGFVVFVISMDAGPNPVNAFDTAILRAQQTGLGILVYSLVAIFLWPSRSINAFNAAATELARTQVQFYQACLGLAHEQGNRAEVQRLSVLGVQAKTRFDQLLDAAEIDSKDVWELRRPWRRYQQQQMELMQAQDRWYESLGEVEALHLQRVLPKLDAFGAELDGRLVQIDHMLDNQAPEQAPKIMELVFDQDALRSLSHFHRAAVVVARSNMLQLEQLTRSLFETVSGLKGFGTTSAAVSPPGKPAAVFLPDLDRLANVIRYVAVIWIAWLALIYVDDLPGGTGLVSFAGSFGIAIANMPQVSVSKLLAPAAGSVLFAGILYIFVMPTLSSFAGLGLMIFVATFAITYLYSEPRQGLSRALGLAMFVVIASITNEQSYSFLSVATTAVMFMLILLIFAITAYFPWSPRPERRFVRLLGRYFRSSEYLMSTMRWNPAHPATSLERWKKAFHAREVATLPAKLGSWAPLLDNWVLSSTSMEQVQTLLTSLQLLSYRMERLLGERDRTQAPFLVQQLLEDIRAWRIGIQTTFHRLAENPAADEQEALRGRLDETLVKLEARIKEVMDNSSDAQYSERDAESFYRLLNAYRAVSTALVDCAENAVAIDWTPWREERFV
jgi:uncharacterized membrane protein YccC